MYLLKGQLPFLPIWYIIIIFSRYFCKVPTQFYMLMAFYCYLSNTICYVMLCFVKYFDLFFSDLKNRLCNKMNPVLLEKLKGNAGALSYVFILILLGVPLWWYTTTVYRYNHSLLSTYLYFLSNYLSIYPFIFPSK